MVNRNLLREIPLSDDELEIELRQAFGSEDTEDLVELYNRAGQAFEVGQIVQGRISKVVGSDVVVDIGYKSEGVIPEREWDSDDGAPTPGAEIEVLLEAVEDEQGLVTLSKRKATRIRAWERLIDKYHEGDVVTGHVNRKVKGGLLVDIGVNVFLPASQVDIRRPNDIAEYIGNDIRCLILTIDQAEHNIVVSRRQLIEREREEMKTKLLAELEVGQIRKGVVKNIASFGAFVDLGGTDGLLHVSDMSWSRIGHPSEVVEIDQELEVMVLNIDRERDRIAVGLKQKEPSPWETIEEEFPVGAKVMGEVVNITNYGAFVKIKDAIEGLVHISEMSWTKRINHPSELVSPGDEIEVVVLAIKKDKREISLGMKQTKPNPWDIVAQKYPPGTVVQGEVQNLTNYGAFIEIEDGIDGLLHVSDMSWVRKVGHPSDVVNKGQVVECQVLTVDQERKRIALGLKQLQGDPWENDIPARYAVGQVVTGKVTKLTNFGVFVELEEGLEGLLHVSEIADHKVDNPEELLGVGDDVECRVLKVDLEDRKIGLSRRRVGQDDEGAETPTTDPSTEKPRELKGGIGSGGGPLIDPKSMQSNPNADGSE